MQTLALKYRPKSFYELIGQDAIKENLILALDSGRIGHAYLFSGLRGSGKTSSARIFAKNLLCEKGISSHSCEVCQSCILANEGRHLDIVEMDAASNRKIEDIRDLIEQTRYTPVNARFKIFIIDEAHMLTKEASNAFLKTLEEPPSYIKFILATTDPLKLPVTILSRTQHFRFKAIAQNAIIKHIEEILAKENVNFESEAIKIIARSGGGSLRDTLTLLDQAIVFCNSNITTKAVVDMLGILDPLKIDEILNIISMGEYDELCSLVKNLQNNDCEMIINELIINLKEKFVLTPPVFSLLIFEKFFKILSESKNMLSFGADPSFVLYITLFMMRDCFNVQNSLKIQNNNFLTQNQTNTLNTPSSLANEQNQNISTTTQNLDSVPKTKQNINELYENFINAIYDRSYEMGENFKKFITFNGFDGVNIKLISALPPQDAQLLRQHSNVLRSIAIKIFNTDKFIIEKKTEPNNDEILNNILSQNMPKSQITNDIKTENKPDISNLLTNMQSKSSSNNAKIAELNNLFGEARIEEM